MKFRRNNRIAYGQDHHFFRGIPAGIDFKIERFCEDRFKLTAYGYGQLEPWDNKSYGNGKIYAYPKGHQRKRFEKAISGKV